MPLETVLLSLATKIGAKQLSIIFLLFIMEDQNQDIIIEEIVVPEEGAAIGADAEGEKGAFSKMPPLSVPTAIMWNAVIIALALIISACILHGTFGSGAKQDPSAATSAATGAAAPAVSIKNVNLSNEPFIGNPQAPVVLAYWSDYQCPFCKQFETATLPQIITNYVQTGKVAVVFKDFSFLGADSTTAALDARAIWQLYPQQYFAWRTAMFNAQDAEDSGFGDEASIEKLTATIPGIDVSKMVAAVAANKDAYQKAIDADRAEAASFGIQGTPSFITGTVLLPGLTDYSVFQKDFDAQLK